METLRVMTVVGTRPEIIRLSQLIKRLSLEFDHKLVHTGQNNDPQLSEVFFRDLGLQQPDLFLEIELGSPGVVVGQTLQKMEAAIDKFSPEAIMILGDTNSALSAYVAERRGIPVYHMEAGNRSFDSNVPEELNRRIVDHMASFNLAYNSYSKANLVREGIDPRRIFVTGSPLREVLAVSRDGIGESSALQDMGLEPGEFFLVSLHRQENVDSPDRLSTCIGTLQRMGELWGKRIVMSVHPRTQKAFANFKISLDGIELCRPFGFFDYMKLQVSAFCVISDSGTISEESAMLGFPAISMRSSIERPEAIDVGSTVLAGVDSRSVSQAIKLATLAFKPTMPEGYEVDDFSERVVRILSSTVHAHTEWLGLRK